MVEKIKALRTDIDGLAQLTKTLATEKKYIFDVKGLPRNWTVSTFIGYFQNTNWGIVDSANEPDETQKKDFEEAKKFLEVIEVGSKECENAFNSLILAKAWLGKVLAELGEETPYKNDGKRTGVEHIEPTADTKSAAHAVGAQGQLEWINKGRVEQVDWIREQIKNISNGDFFSEMSDVGHAAIEKEKSSWYSEYCYREYSKNMTEARFWLGFELQRMKKESNNG